jgi:probable phosphoglycerate mutase
MNTRLILLRHGETEANVAQIWQGSLDAPLSPKGQAQVAATADRFQELVKTFPVDRIYVSPAGRAQRTAAPIVDVLGHPAQVHDPLREFDLGDWEGRSFQDLRETEDLWARWDRDPTFSPPNGESPATFHRRAVGALTELADAHPGETVLAVTHGGIIANALSEILGDGPHEWDRWEAHNCAITVLERNGDGWHGVLVNDIDHLGEALRES